MQRRAVIKNRRSGGVWWRVIVVLLVWLSYAVPLSGGVAAYLLVRDYARDLPAIPDLDAWERGLPRTTVIRARDGTVLAEIPFEDGKAVGHRSYTSLSRVPRVLIEAFLAAEDVRFLRHRGVDVRSVIRAARANYEAGKVVEGASTITQQLARGLLPETVGTERSLRRKVREALVSMRLERAASKPQLLEAYLNFVFLGAGAYGVEAAARAYFDKPLNEILPHEAALIAGLAQAPGRANPYRDVAAATERRNQVLRRMQRAGFLDAEATEAALAEPIALTRPSLRYGLLAGWHTERVRQEIEGSMPEAYRRGGLDVVTAVEIPQSILASRVTHEWLRKRWKEDEAPQVAALLWDHVTGYVEVTLGGRSFAESKFDRATQACRQPGSVFKPVVYTAALERDVITPGTPLRDAPIAEFDWDLEVHWKPKNSGRSFRGVALAQDALASSLNAPAVDVLDRVGTGAVVELAKRVGIESRLTEVRPLALGSSCVVPLQLARLYASIAAGGADIPSIFAISASRRGMLLIDRASPYDPSLRAERTIDRLTATVAKEPMRLIDRKTAFLMRSMLRAVVERGTGVAARRMDPPVAGKTGTTNDNTDAWFIGFSPRVVGAVWLGHDNPAKSLGPRSDGGRAALPLWKKLVAIAEKGREGGSIPGDPPEGVVRLRVDRDTGLLARPGTGGALDLYFKEGTGPTESSAHGRDVPADLHRATRDF